MTGSTGGTGGTGGTGSNTWPAGYPRRPGTLDPNGNPYPAYVAANMPLINPSATVHVPPLEVPATSQFTGVQLDEFIRAMIEGFLKQVVLALTNAFETGVEAFDQLAEWGGTLLTDTWEALLTLLDTLFGPFDLEAFLQPLFALLEWAWNLITSLIDVEGFQAFVERIVNALNPLLSATGFADVFTRVVEFFSGIVTLTAGIPLSLEELIQRIPVLSTLVSTITGFTEADGVSLDLGTLSTYFRNLDDQLSEGVRKLQAAAEKLLGGIIPVSLISNTPTNLLSQGDFLTSSTVDPANGWSWDGSQSRTGTGGSLKVTCTNSEQRIYCRQDIRVAEGDRLTLTGYVGTSPGYTSGSMRLSIQPWGPQGSPPVMTAKTVVNGTARTTSASSYAALPQLDYTVPAGVTSIQVSLVANCNTGCNVYFDDIRLTKTGVLPQDLVTNLLDAINGILAGTGYFIGQGWTKLQEALGLVTKTANDGFQETEQINTTLFNDPAGGTTVSTGALDLPTIATELGTAGSGGKMWKASGTANLLAGPSPHAFAGFYDNGSTTSDISYSTANGTFTVTHAGFYEVEVGFTVNASPGMSGAFNVAPAIGTPALDKIGSTAFGSYGFGLGGYARTAHSTFIVQLPAYGTVTAAYYNYFDTGITNFFQGGATNTYFSIAMLNRSQEG